MPDNIASETGDFRFKQNRQFIKAGVCGGQPDPGFARAAAARVSQADPPDAPATGGSSSPTGRTVACHGKGCPAPWRHWNRWSGLAQKFSSHTASSSQLLMAADQRPQMLQESRAKAFYQCPKSLQKKGVCEDTAWYWSVGSIFTFLVTPVISGLHSGKHIW